MANLRFDKIRLNNALSQRTLANGCVQCLSIQRFGKAHCETSLFARIPFKITSYLLSYCSFASIYFNLIKYKVLVYSLHIFLYIRLLCYYGRYFDNLFHRLIVSSSPEIQYNNNNKY